MSGNALLISLVFGGTYRYQQLFCFGEERQIKNKDALTDKDACEQH
jgi:hypothetical protein